MKQTTGFTATQDGVRLAYAQDGPINGPELIFIPAWRQTMLEWRKQVDYFSTKGFRVTTYDHRGHGESEKPKFGHRMYRYAADLHDVIRSTELALGQNGKKLTLVGHSMSVGVICAMWELYPALHKIIKGLVLVDQVACIVDGFGGSLSPAQPIAMARDMRNMTILLLGKMFTPAIPKEELDWVIQQNLLMDDESAAEIFLDHCFSDWRPVLPRIDVPTLVIAAEKSTQSVEGLRKVAALIPGSRLEVFGADEGGSHFMFWENPEKFNQLVGGFLASLN